MAHENTATRVADVERAVGFIVRSEDPEIYRLVDRLNAALGRADRVTLRQIAKQIAEHAAFRYAAVVEQADCLVRHLDEV
jgi:hypothetical protein